jgi:hypothetical protein
MGKYIYNGNDPSKISIYTGEFKNGKKDGLGKFVWADKSSYAGGF